MSGATYFSNVSFVENGDLFKIMELRYSHSIYDENGYLNVEQPVSNSLELIQWYRNCEAYFYQLSAEDKNIGTLQENDFKSFQDELGRLVIDRDVFGNCGITEYSKECRMAYTKFQLNKYSDLTQDKNNETEINKLLKNVYPVRDELKSIAKHPQRFDLDDDRRVMLEDLHFFLEKIELTYFLAFDIEIGASQFADNCNGNWLLRALILKLILENALEHILKGQTDVLRFYVKLEDNGVYGYRFHTVIFLRSIILTEQRWLADFRTKLEQVLTDELLLSAWVKPLHTKKLERFRNNRDLTELMLSEEKVNKIEQDMHSEFERFYKTVSFQIINWNNQLRQIYPDLKFGIESFTTIEDRQLLEYWGVKYLFMSNKYICFHLHDEELHPSLKCFVNQSSEIKQSSNVLATYKLSKDTRPSVKNSTPQPKHSNNRVAQTNKVVVPSQRRSGDPLDAFYDAKRDFTLTTNLSLIPIPSQKNRFAIQKVEKTIRIDVGPPSADQVINLSTICVLQDFIDYVLDEKNAICKAEIKNKERIGWAEIFYRNTIRDAELLEFLIKFERLIDNLLHSKNPFFAVKRQQSCRPVDLSPIGGQFLALFFNFHTQYIANKINETNIRSDHWDWLTRSFETYHGGDISQVVMHKEQIQTLNDMMKKAQVLAKHYEKKMHLHLKLLKYANGKLWQKAFDQERILMRCHFSLPRTLHEKSGITGIFNSFKTRLSGKDRQFKDVGHIRFCRKINQRESLDVLLIFDNAQGAEDQKGLSKHIEDLWIKSVKAEINKQYIQASPYELEQLVRYVDFIPEHEHFAVKYLYLRDRKAAIDKSVISHLIPYFISQAIFLQDVSSGSTHRLSMSQNLTKLFDKKIPEKKDASMATGKPSKPKI